MRSDLRAATTESILPMSVSFDTFVLSSLGDTTAAEHGLGETMSQRSTSMRRMQWAAVVLCAAAIAINYLDRSTLAVGNVEIRREFGINATQFGALQSAWSLCYAFAQIPIGLVVDRLGPGVLLGVALILWSIAQAAGGLVSGYVQQKDNQRGDLEINRPEIINPSQGNQVARS
jgi:hypothetical protein